MTHLHSRETRDPVVSIVIPAYNAEAYLGPTLRSVLEQTFDAFEVIVVDDRSRDGTAAVVDGFFAHDPRIKLIRLEKNYGGPAGPRNVGVREASGTWIAFLDSDDIWHPDKLRLQLEVLDRTGAKFCSSQMVDFEQDEKLAFTPAHKASTSRISFVSLLIKPRVPTSSVVVSKELVSRYRFNESPRYKAREDFDCWLHCHEEIGHSVKVNHPLVGYRVSPQQISGNKWTMVGRHFHVLREYRFRSGRKLGLGAIPFTLTHFILSYYYRTIRRKL